MLGDTSNGSITVGAVPQAGQPTAMNAAPASASRVALLTARDHGVAIDVGPDEAEAQNRAAVARPDAGVDVPGLRHDHSSSPPIRRAIASYTACRSPSSISATRIAPLDPPLATAVKAKATPSPLDFVLHLLPPPVELAPTYEDRVGG